MRKTERLKSMLLAPQVLVCAGVYDALSARMAEVAGFQAIQISGYGLSASLLGMTDASFTSLEEVAQITANVARVVDIPVMADGDTGYGNAVNVWWTTRRLEAAGAAGMNLEDQVFPKRCGHMAGKELISIEEMAGKIKAAVDARSDPSFVINARTDAAALFGIDEAIRRGKSYIQAGADMVFVESPSCVDDIHRAVREIGGPVSIAMLEGGLTPHLSFRELEELGVARISCPMFASLVTAQALQTAFAYLKQHECSKDYPDFMSFSEFQAITDTEKVREMEQRYIYDMQKEGI